MSHLRQWTKSNWGRFIVSQLSHTVITVVILGMLFFSAARVGALNGLLTPLSQTTGSSFTTFRYQGRLADSVGNPIDNTNPGVGMTFTLYDVETGGAPLWSETHANVPVSAGLFSVRLGSTNPLNAALLNGDRWLGIQIGTDAEMAPREKLDAVPYAIQAGEALTVTDESITEAKIADGAVTRDKLASSAIPQPMQSGSIVLSNPPPNYPTSHDWVDIQELQTVIQIDQPSVVFVAGHIFVEGDSTAISDMRIVIGDSISGDTRYQGRFWQTAPLNHVTHLQPGTHTIKVQIRAYPDSPIAGDGHIGYPTSLSYFVQPEP